MNKYTDPFELIYGAGAEAEIIRMKSNLLIMLTEKLRKQCKTRKEMSELLNVSTSEISKMMNGKLSSISFEKLLKHLHRVGVKMNAGLDVNDGVVTTCSISLNAQS